MNQSLVSRVDDRLIPLLRRWSVPILRMSLAVVFVWFGALKLFRISPVFDLVADTVYWVDPNWFVPFLGVVEMSVGLGLAFRVGLRLVLAVLVAQLVGTFLVFVLLPDVAFQKGNPLVLTTEGEFVVKNLVLLAAAMTIGALIEEEQEEMPRPETGDSGPRR
ncbi:MAG: DoxX family membrane protein [Acidimicrobiia bacterium]